MVKVVIQVGAITHFGKKSRFPLSSCSYRGSSFFSPKILIKLDFSYVELLNEGYTGSTGQHGILLEPAFWKSSRGEPFGKMDGEECGEAVL